LRGWTRLRRLRRRIPLLLARGMRLLLLLPRGM
jgi:hypothetical protein